MRLIVFFLATVAIVGAACIPTGFYRDGINMTAAVVNPATTITGTIDATGCNVGVYIDKGRATIQKADIFGANYFGVVVNGDVNVVTADVIGSSIHNIGEVPFNGSQHGVAIYYRALGFGSVTGKIWENQVYKYQKNGIVTNGAGMDANIKDNVVIGEGCINYIAQNGIQVAWGAKATVMRNIVKGNCWAGPYWASAGILIIGDTTGYTIGTQIQGNTVVDNQVGVYLSNADDAYLPPVTPTNIKVVNNTITSANDPAALSYSAGVAVIGNGDKIINNTISGVGYAPPIGYQVDASAPWAVKAKVHATK